MTTTNPPVVVAVFQNDAQAQQAINDLLNAGFRDDQISYSGHGTDTGGFLDKLKSFFTGEETTAGADVDNLENLGVPQGDADYYRQEYNAGSSIVAVRAGDRTPEATDIMARDGGRGYASRNRTTQTADFASTDTTAARATQAADFTSTDTTAGGEAQRVKLREEQLQASKHPAQTGEVDIRKDVVTEQRTVDVPVTHEEVYIERRPASGQASDTPIGEGETIRIPVSQEQVDVSKQTVETGEVAIGKRPITESQQVSDTVRREEAHVEQTGDVDIQGIDTDTKREGQ